MTLRELAAGDSAALYDMDGDDITLTSPDSSEVYLTRGQYVRRGVDVDPGTGLPVQADTSAFTVSLLSLSSAGLTDPDRLRSEKGWIISALDVLGHEVSMRVKTALLDRTIGRATIIGSL